jgi:hypothetical protein
MVLSFCSGVVEPEKISADQQIEDIFSIVKFASLA